MEERYMNRKEDVKGRKEVYTLAREEKKMEKTGGG